MTYSRDEPWIGELICLSGFLSFERFQFPGENEGKNQFGDQRINYYSTLFEGPHPCNGFAEKYMIMMETLFQMFHLFWRSFEHCSEPTVLHSSTRTVNTDAVLCVICLERGCAWARIETYVFEHLIIHEDWTRKTIIIVYSLESQPDARSIKKIHKLCFLRIHVGRVFMCATRYLCVVPNTQVPLQNYR